MVMSAFDFDLDEVRVLDAFGGSGALGLEMLSRAPARSRRSRSIGMPRGSLPRISSRCAVTVRVGAW